MLPSVSISIIVGADQFGSDRQAGSGIDRVAAVIASQVAAPTVLLLKPPATFIAKVWPLSKNVSSLMAFGLAEMYL